MKKIFALDSPLMQGLSTMADLMLLNIVTLIFCIPIVTIGASLTAAHYVSLKMVRNEESYIIRGFWKSFKQNFKQATGIGLIVLVAILVLAGDLYIIFAGKIELHSVIVALILAATVLACLGLMYVFPVLAKFDNKTSDIFKNAILFSIMNLPKSILMLIIYIIPIALMLVAWQAFPLVMLLGISGPIYFSAMLYNKIFQKMESLAEPAAEEAEAMSEEDEERIFHDEPME